MFALACIAVTYMGPITLCPLHNRAQMVQCAVLPAHTAHRPTSNTGTHTQPHTCIITRCSQFSLFAPQTFDFFHIKRTIHKYKTSWHVNHSYPLLFSPSPPYPSPLTVSHTMIHGHLASLNLARL